MAFNGYHPGQGLNRSERLKSRKQIKALFSHGHSQFVFPYQLIYLDNPEPTPASPVQAAFSVPKRKFSKAVDRHLIKRRMREAYRKNKFILYDYLLPKQKALTCMFIYSTRDILESDFMEKRMIRILKELRSKLENQTGERRL